MASIQATLLVALNLGVALGFIITGIYIYREYSELGAASFAGFVALFGINILGNYVGLTISVLSGGPIAESVYTLEILSELTLPQYLEIALIGSRSVSYTAEGLIATLWGIFVLKYTTRSQWITTIRSLLVGFFILAGVRLGLTNAGLVENTGIIQSLGDLIQFLGFFIVYGSVLGGSVKLYQTSRRFRLLTTPILGSLLGTIWFPILGSGLVGRGIVPWGVIGSFTHLVGSLLGLGCIWLVVEYYGIFDLLPVARTVGRDTAIDTLESPILVLGQDRIITDFNEAAARIFDMSDTDLVGVSLATVLPDPASAGAVWEPGRTEFQFPASDRIIEAETTVSTDDDGDEIGRTIVLYDITDQRRRQQRIEVLNRVLRHNLRNDLAIVDGYMDLIADGGVKVTEYSEKIGSQIEGLVDLAETAREIEEMLAKTPTVDSPVRLDSLIEDAIDSATSESVAASITMNVPADIRTRANPALLQPVLRELVENAIEHNDSQSPEVNIMAQQQGSTVIITDNGPGIPDHEVSVLEAGEETALEHGSGLGLWLVRWGLDRVGGTISFDTEAGGTRVTLQFPESLVTR